MGDDMSTGYIPQEILDEIVARCDIVSVINEYVPLKRRGSNYQGLCPFHNEKTPSFSVSPSKQIFHCFVDRFQPKPIYYLYGCIQHISLMFFFYRHHT